MCLVIIAQQIATFDLHNISTMVLYNGVESVYSVLQTDSLYKTETFSL